MTVQMDVTTLAAPYHEGLRAVEADERVVIGAAADDVAGTTILVAEDDGTCRRALQHYLRRIGYNVAEAATATSTLESVFALPADLVVLDLEESDGTSQALSQIRLDSTVPVIVCAGRATERDRVDLLDLGADDLLGKPFSFAELEARVRAVLRRGSAAPSMRLEYGDLVIDEGTRTVTVDSTDVPMTRKEFDLLAFLANAPGRVFSRDDLLERVWGSNGRWQGRSTVTEHIRRVRLKIEEDPESPRWITTIRGIGYRFAAPVD
jgi:two-component system, OmpR family, phosphate regulon response regulator PhoB